MATNAKWYQIVAEKIRVSPISNIRPESVMRKTAACMAIWVGDITGRRGGGQLRVGRRTVAGRRGPSGIQLESALILSVATNGPGPPRLAACPLCLGTDAASLSGRGIALARCGGCGLTRAEPQPSAAALDAIYTAGYFLGDETAEGRARLRGLKRASARRYLAELARYRGPHGGRLLEVGCGTGDFLAEARAAGYDVAGVEVSAAAAAEARAAAEGASVSVGELSAAAFPPGTFDVCVLWDVLEHARDPVELLRSVHAVLRPGGVVALATPSLDSWSARLLGRRWMEFKTEHLFYFDRGTLEGTLWRAGFLGLVVAPGWKVLSLDYVARHFERFRVPLVTPLLRAARGLLPPLLRDRPLPVVASGVLAFGRKRRAARSAAAVGRRPGVQRERDFRAR